MKKTSLLFTLLLSACLSVLSQGIDFTYTLRFDIYGLKDGMLTLYEDGAGIWIPDAERDIKGLVLTTMIRNEYEFNKDPYIRAACAEQNLAMIFFYGEEQGDYYTGGRMGGFNPEAGHDTAFNSVLRRFAEMSGKPEIMHAPWLTFAHSAGITFCRNLAWWRPDKTFGVIHYKTGGINAPSWADPEASIIGIPWLAVSARVDKFEPVLEQGWNDSRAEVMRWRRKGHTISHIVEPTMEEGHSIWREFNGPYLATFISKAAQIRIPRDTIAKDGPVPLRTIHETWGVLSDTLTEVLMDQETVPDGIIKYVVDVDDDDRDEYFWHLDAEMAITWVNYEHRDYDPFIPEGDTVLSGMVKYWQGNIPMGDNNMMPTGVVVPLISNFEADSIETGGTAQTSSSGSYEIGSKFPLVGVECDIQGEYGSNDFADVQGFINAADALLIHKIVYEDLSFKPDEYEISAADVNMDGKVSQEDIDQVMERAVSKIPEFRQQWNYQGGEEPMPGARSMDFVFMDSLWNKFNPKTRLSADYPDDDGKGFSRHRLPGLCKLVSVGYSDGVPYPIYKKNTIFSMALGDVDASFTTVWLQPEQMDTIFIGSPEFSTDWDTARYAITLGAGVECASLDLGMESLGPLVKGANAEYELVSVETAAENVLLFNASQPFTRLSLYSPSGQLDEASVATLVFKQTGGSVTPNVIFPAAYLDGKKAYVVAPDIGSSVETDLTEEMISIFPNPAREYLYLSISNQFSGSLDLRVIDLDGRVVLSKQVQKNSDQQEFTIATAELSSGLYLLSIASADGKQSLQKFIIE